MDLALHNQLNRFSARDRAILGILSMAVFGQSLPAAKAVGASIVLAVAANVLAKLYTSVRLNNLHQAVAYGLEKMGPQAVFNQAVRHYSPAQLLLQGGAAFLYGALHLGN